MAERLKAPHSKCGLRVTAAGVRIPPSPFILRPVNPKSRIRRLLSFWDVPRFSRLWRFLWQFVAGDSLGSVLMARKNSRFRVGKVSAYLRGNIWYLNYFEGGKRKRPRVGSDKEAARRMAAQTNAQLEVGAPAPLSFESITIVELRNRWLHYHEHVLRSSVATVKRYRAATAHLMTFVHDTGAPKHAANFSAAHVEAFATYLRGIKVAPNGHRNSAKRPLRDKGVRFILEACRALFSYAAKRRHLPPYTDNPFSAIQIDRIPVEDVRRFQDISPDQERAFLLQCDDWQFPVFVTMFLTGVRPGELRHLLIPDDLDLDQGYLFIRNKVELGWQVKTRNERTIPMIPELLEVLRSVVGERRFGPVFMRRTFSKANLPVLFGMGCEELQVELNARIHQRASALGQSLSREQIQRLADSLWSDMGAVRTDRMRTEFMRLTKSIGLPLLTAPKTLRHLFATALQDANVDPLIRNQLMGHVSANDSRGGGLATTSVYTHSRPETVRRQLEEALRHRPAAACAREWVANRSHR